MKIPSLAAFLLLLATACSESSPGARLVGVWEASIEEILEAAGAEGRAVPDEVADMSITVEFASDGKFSFKQTIGNLEQIETGTWEVTSDDGKRIRVKLITKVGDQSSSKEGEAVFTDDDTCEFLPVQANSPKLFLKRKRQP